MEGGNFHETLMFHGMYLPWTYRGPQDLAAPNRDHSTRDLGLEDLSAQPQVSCPLG
jgi:hypothetical protein